MVTTFVIGIMAASAPGLGALSTTFNLDNGTRTVAMALSQARVYAITRGHVVNVSFTSQSFTTTDTEAGSAVLMSGKLPAQLTVTASGPASFSPLGTVGAPVVVTVERATHTRTVRVGITGEVQIE